MAKKKKKKAAAKAPKEIAGVKIPKPLREPAARLLEAVKHPVVADVAAAALIAAAAALRDSRTVKSAAGAASEKAGQAASGAGALGAIVAAKAIDGVRKLAAEGRSREAASAAPQKPGRGKKNGS